MQTPAEIIAAYSEPSPQLFLKLALVNKQFYAAFMSDAVWSKLDVYQVGQDVARHYLRIKAQMSSVEQAFCSSFNFGNQKYPEIDLQTFNTLSLYTTALVLAEPFAKRAGLYSAVSSREAFLFAGKRKDALYYSSRVLRNERQFVQLMIGLNPTNFYYASEKLKDDAEVAVLAIQSGYARALEVSSQRLRNCREVVEAAVEANGLAIQWASVELRGNPGLCWLAVRSNPLAFQFCLLERRIDLDLALEACTRAGCMLAHAGPLQANEKLALAALGQDLSSFEYVSQQLKDKLVLAAIFNS